MASLKKFLSEDTNLLCFDDYQHAVVAYGKFNPPHIGLNELFGTLVDAADSTGGPAIALMNVTEGEYQLPAHICKKYLEKLYPRVTFLECHSFRQGLELMKAVEHIPGTLCLPHDANMNVRVSQIREVFNNRAGAKLEYIHYTDPDSLNGKVNSRRVFESAKAGNVALVKALTGLNIVDAEILIEWVNYES